MIFSLDNIFNSLKWVTLIVAIVSTLITISFPTSDNQAELLGYVGLQFGATPGSSPIVDTPLVLTFIWILWFVFILSQTSWKALKVSSDRIIIDGINKTESCVTSELHPKGEFGFIRVGGVKLIPDIEGRCVWINPLTHIHVIENTIWMEAHASPNTGLEDVPPDLKYDIYQRRNELFGINKCSIGFLSGKEQQEHTGFNGKEYEDAVSQDDKKLWTTSTFITDIMTRNKAISVLFDYFGDDTSPIEKKLGSIKRIGRAANTQEKRGIIDLLKSGED